MKLYTTSSLIASSTRLFNMSMHFMLIRVKTLRNLLSAVESTVVVVRCCCRQMWRVWMEDNERELEWDGRIMRIMYIHVAMIHLLVDYVPPSYLLHECIKSSHLWWAKERERKERAEKRVNKLCRVIIRLFISLVSQHSPSRIIYIARWWVFMWWRE